MSRAGLIAVALLLPLSGASAMPAVTGTVNSVPAVPVERVAVFGLDDRKPLPPRLHRLESSIGLLYDQSSHSVCTAFCVGDDIVATAAHCLYGTEGESAPVIKGITFRLPAKKENGRTSRIAGARSDSAAQFVTSGAMTLSVRPPIDASRDYAFVKLTEPMCKGANLPVNHQKVAEIEKLAAANRIYQVAYHRDFGNWQLAFGAPCDIRRSFETADRRTIERDFTDAEHVLLHTCDTGGASSGSPLLIDGPAGPEVVGINVGTYVQSKVLLQDGEVVHRYKASAVANTGVATAAFTDRLSAFMKADILPSRDKLRELQVLLTKRGQYDGPSDGIYGPKLRTAIEAFEYSEGLPETGFATTALLARLIDVAGTQTSHHGDGQSTGLEPGRIGAHEVTRAKATVPVR